MKLADERENIRVSDPVIGFKKVQVPIFPADFVFEKDKEKQPMLSITYSEDLTSDELAVAMLRTAVDHVRMNIYV